MKQPLLQTGVLSMCKKHLCFSVCAFLALIFLSAPAFSMPYEKAASAAGLSVDLYFVQNHGQADETVLFYSKGLDSTVLFLNSGISFFVKSQNRRLLLSPLGQNNASVSGQRPLPGLVNYFKGQNPADWKKNLPTYSAVSYAGLWPGIDLLFYPQGRLLEYDVKIAPGADVKQVVFAAEGASGLEIQKNGDMAILFADNSSMIQKRPIAFQENGREQIPVEAAFKILAQNGEGKAPSFGFELGPHDPALPVTIDPILDWSTYLGGSQEDFVAGIATDDAGGVIVAGHTAGGFPVTGGSYQEAFQGGNFDIFVAKYNSEGNLVFATYLGGSGIDNATGIAVDAQRGDIYVCGHTNSNNFPVFNHYPGGNALKGAEDAVSFRLNTNGDVLFFSAYLGGSGKDRAKAIALPPPPASAGLFYIAGWTDNGSMGDFPVTDGSPQRLFGGGSKDAFVARINHPADNQPAGLNGCTYLGGNGDDIAYGIAVDSGNVFVGGKTSSTDQSIKSHFANVRSIDGQQCRGTSENNNSAFVARLTPNMDAVPFCSCFGGDPSQGTADQAVLALAADNQGFVYATGYTSAPGFPVTQGAFSNAAAAGTSAFLSKINPHPNREGFEYSFVFGGSGADKGQAIALDPEARPYVGGQTASQNFPLVSPYQNALASNKAAFVSKFDALGRWMSFSTYMGGKGASESSITGLAITFPPTVLHAGGNTNAADFPVKDAWQPANAGGQDGFVIKFEPSPGDTAPKKADISDSGSGSCFVQSARGF
jgi:hypothetical protein